MDTLEKLQKLVKEQEEDESLILTVATPQERYLQKAIQKLHRGVEAHIHSLRGYHA